MTEKLRVCEEIHAEEVMIKTGIESLLLAELIIYEVDREIRFAKRLDITLNKIKIENM